MCTRALSGSSMFICIGSSKDDLSFYSTHKKTTLSPFATAAGGTACGRDGQVATCCFVVLLKQYITVICKTPTNCCGKREIRTVSAIFVIKEIILHHRLF